MEHNLFIHCFIIGQLFEEEIMQASYRGYLEMVRVESSTGF